MANSPHVSKVHEEFQKYVKSKRIDNLVSSLLEDIIRQRPSHVPAFVLHYLFTRHVEETKPAHNVPAVIDLANRLEFKVYAANYTTNGYSFTLDCNPQADLDKYLAEHSVQAVLTAAVEHVLVSEPPNHFVAIIEYLCKTYPEDGLIALELLNPPKARAKNMLGKNAVAMIMTGSEKAESKDVPAVVAKESPALRSPSTASSEEEDEGEDEEEEAVGPLPVAMLRSTLTTGGKRRQSVSSESVDPARLKEQIAQVKVIAKDTETMHKLYHIITKSAMLKRMLDPEERTILIKALQGPESHVPGANIIIQGEAGNHFYIIETGVVDVFVRSAGGGEKKVHSYHDGDAFGQLALLYNAPRAATCRAATEVKLWSLDRLSFKVIIAGAAMRKRELYTAFLQKVPLLQTLNEFEIATLADALGEERFADQEIVCRQGEPGNHFYIVLEGTADCYVTSSDGAEQKLVLSLTMGQYFGEIALLTAKPRQATVRARGALRVLSIDRETFVRVFGRMENVLKRNMETYNLFMQLPSDCG